jgi:hypothetical protein
MSQESSFDTDRLMELNLNLTILCKLLEHFDVDE